MLCALPDEECGSPTMFVRFEGRVYCESDGSSGSDETCQAAAGDDARPPAPGAQAAHFEALPAVASPRKTQHSRAKVCGSTPGNAGAALPVELGRGPALLVLGRKPNMLLPSNWLRSRRGESAPCQTRPPSQQQLPPLWCSQDLFMRLVGMAGKGPGWRREDGGPGARQKGAGRRRWGMLNQPRNTF